MPGGGQTRWRMSRALRGVGRWGGARCRRAAGGVLLLLGIGTGRCAVSEKSLEYDRLAGRIEARAEFAVKARLFLSFARAAVRSGKCPEAQALLERLIVRKVKTLSGRLVPDRDFEALSNAATAAAVLELFGRNGGKTTLAPEVLGWLLANHARAGALVRTIRPQDRWLVVQAIIQRLADYAPDRRDRFFRLILAFAVVWDAAGGVRRSSGGEREYAEYIRSNTDLILYYDYYCKLYSGPRAKVDYDRLRVEDLVWVVDLPVGLDELEWALQHVRGNASTWGKRYGEVEYSGAKLVQGASAYGERRTLQKIKRFGGVCVDQAYYTVMTARAFGIPAMMITGMGRGGGHAWAGYQKDDYRDEWDLKTGRYDGAGFERGSIRDPQTGERITEQQFLFRHDPMFRRKAARVAEVWARLARIALHSGRCDLARVCASTAVRALPISPQAWDALEAVYVREGDKEGLLEVLARRVRALRDYPEIAADVRLRREALLREMGRMRDARTEVGRLKRLQHGEKGGKSIENSADLRTFEALKQQGKEAQARRELERLLEKNASEGAKTVPLVRLYLRYTKESGLTGAAVRFLGPYLKRMHATYGRGNVLVDTVFLDLLAEAYRNNGDTAKLKRLKKQISRDTFQSGKGADEELKRIRTEYQTEPEKARRRLERLLNDWRKDGKSVTPLVREYLALTREHGQAARAARFLDHFLSRVASAYSLHDRVGFLRLKAEAWENAGDQRKAERIRRRIARQLRE